MAKNNIEQQLKECLQKPYESSECFLEDIIFPVFGEDNFEPAGNLHILKKRPDLQPKADATGIEDIRMMGNLFVEGSELGIFDVTLDFKKNLQRNRVELQQIVRSILSSHSGAFIIFHYNSGAKWGWRFTFCHKGASNLDSTDAKRYTYLLGPGQSCRTAAENFMKLHDKIENDGEFEMDDIIKAFDVEALSKEFFEKYKQHYEAFCQFVYDNKNNREYFGEDFSKWEDKTIRDYVKKLLGRIVFLHFLQKKGWMGVPADKEWGEGDTDFMLHLYQNATEEQKNNYLDEVLEPLFSMALDTDRTANSDLFDTKVEGFKNVKIPYLNGGLFERDKLDEPDSAFPAKLFKDLFEFFYQYNFTIDENDPNDAQVGVDPEMLGRIFENLLEDNKDKGAFYTPKEIVQYMCKESLIAYLQTDVKGEETKTAIRNFVTTYDIDVLGGKDSATAKDIDELLKSVKICDPAIGSGAFPMGLLKELFYCRGAIEAFDNAAEIKRHIIQQNIYGVDIEKGAVDIARLRFWLALIVDEKTPHALPNMDFKIMQGNSLLEQYKGFDLSTIMMSKTKVEGPVQMTFFEDHVDLLRHQLIATRRAYFGETNKIIKKSLRQSMQDIVQQQINTLSYNIDLTGIDITENSEFFLWHTWFADVFENGGFDIVIGNPPYIQLQADNGLLATLYDKKGFDTFTKMGDIYCLFYEQGYRLLKDCGNLCFITSDKWMRAGYGEKTRNMFATKTNPKLLIDFEGVNVFDSATVVTNILLFAKENNNHQTYCSATTKYDVNCSIDVFLNKEQSICSFTSKDTWVILSQIEQRLRNKIAKKGTILKDWDICMNYGLKTGYNDAFIISTSLKEHLLAKCSSTEERERTESLIKPVLRGRDVSTYTTNWADLWLIWIPWHFPNHFDDTIQGASQECQDLFEETYPTIFEYLLSHKDALESRNKSETGIRYEWYALQRWGAKYWKEFSFEKIVWGNLNCKASYSWADKDVLISAPCTMITPASKYLLAVLNSKVADYCIRQLGVTRNGGYFEYKPMFVEKIPVPQIGEESKRPIETLVDQILTLKKQGPHSDTLSLETQIDRLVYELYGLTNVEVKIIDPEAHVTGADNELFKA